MLGDVTPSKVHRRGRLSSQGDRFLYDFTNLSEIIQEEWTHDLLSFGWQRPQSLELTTSTSSESDEEVWQRAIRGISKSHLAKALQFGRTLSHREANLEPDEDVWQTAIRLRPKAHTVRTYASTFMYELIAGQRPPETDWRLSLHEELRPSNLLVFSLPPEQETELTPDEKHYQELNQKYYNGTITEEERLQLVRLEETLDEADAQDPQLVALSKDLSAGYDKLHTGLRQVNRILDELLEE
jgi:hypothetical protein